MVTLRPMTDREFQDFLDESVLTYASEKVRAGNWSAEEARQRSLQAHHELLPNGLTSAHQHLYTIEVDGAPAGRLWLCSDASVAGGAGFIYDLLVDEGFRGRGVATAAMRLLEAQAARLGLKSLALHVFGHNTAARALYLRLGYEITNINMSKKISADGPATPGRASSLPRDDPT